MYDLNRKITALPKLTSDQVFAAKSTQEILAAALAIRPEGLTRLEIIECFKASAQGIADSYAEAICNIKAKIEDLSHPLIAEFDEVALEEIKDIGEIGLEDMVHHITEQLRRYKSSNMYGLIFRLDRHLSGSSLLHESSDMQKQIVDIMAITFGGGADELPKNYFSEHVRTVENLETQLRLLKDAITRFMNRDGFWISATDSET